MHELLELELFEHGKTKLGLIYLRSELKPQQCRDIIKKMIYMQVIQIGTTIATFGNQYIYIKSYPELNDAKSIIKKIYVSDGKGKPCSESHIHTKSKLKPE